MPRRFLILPLLGLQAVALAVISLAGCSQRGGKELARGEARQVPDTAFIARVNVTPRFVRSPRPTVVIDEAHQNFHTAAGRYLPFARLLETDGAEIRRGTGPFDSSSLASARLLVIANALNARHVRNTDWRLPAASAFEKREILAVREWVRSGGSLLLIADHMPFAGDAGELALAFGVHFANGFAIPPVPPDSITGDYPIVFRAADSSLGASAVTTGVQLGSRIDSIASFTGSAFWIDAEVNAIPLMRLPAGTRVRLPLEAWKFSDSTAELAGDRMSQGALFEFGRGRVAVFGEAAMFTAQRKGVARIAMGMNADIARQNARFALNVVEWLLHAE